MIVAYKSWRKRESGFERLGDFASSRQKCRPSAERLGGGAITTSAIISLCFYSRRQVKSYYKSSRRRKAKTKSLSTNFSSDKTHEKFIDPDLMSKLGNDPDLQFFPRCTLFSFGVFFGFMIFMKLRSIMTMTSGLTSKPMVLFRT